MYIYKAKLVRIVNGDTIRCWIDLGFGVSLQSMTIKLKNIKAPIGIKGEDASMYLAEILPQNFSLKTQLEDGIIIAEIMSAGKSINDLMLESGLVTKYQK
jgi:endonuclease YncB( thermonuclease family)